MSDVKVMVVDDSAAMRALFCDILDQAKGVTVVGTARNADDARKQLPDLKPDVLTLDVEMPGMSGMDFLVEVMETNPMPVIMLSSITQAGTGTAEKALQLGAVHCFPKPQHASPEEFSATVNKLGSVVIKAAKGELGGDTEGSDMSGAYQSDGRLVVLASDTGGIPAIRDILAAYPANCPPTLIVLDADKADVESALTAMRSSIACNVAVAKDGDTVMPDTVYLSYDRKFHVVIENGQFPIIRLMDREPVAGARPSADLLFGSIARSNMPSIAGLLVGKGTDGAKGAQMLGTTNSTIFAQKPADYEARERYDAVEALGLKLDVLTKAEIAGWILAQTSSSELKAA